MKIEIGCDDVVHAGKVGPVDEVESLGQQLEAGLCAELEGARQAHVEADEIRTPSGIAARSDRPVVRGMAISIHVGAAKKGERMTAVSAHDGGEFEAASECVFPLVIDRCREGKLVPLIKLWEAQ